jgi:hypothetical protein
LNEGRTRIDPTKWNPPLRFLDLTHPYYQTDQADNAANPIRQVDHVGLPGIVCSACGSTWAGSRRLYVPLQDAALRHKLRDRGGWPLPDTEWRQLAQEVHAATSLAADFMLMPGDKLEAPIFEVTKAKLHDFLHPFPGTLVVKKAVVDVLHNAGLTGWKPVRAQVRWGGRAKQSSDPTPELYVLHVVGAAWRIGMDRERITVCTECGRPKPVVGLIGVDEARWDGSDFFHADLNPNIVVVTDKVNAVLSEHGFTNFACVEREF